MKKIILLLIIILPTFSLMLRSGIYTMHDFHVFRQFEFNQSLQQFKFPARWAPDSTKGFGQPLFNFYGQIPYWVGAIVGLTNLGVLFSVKVTFILTLVAAALAMYLFVKNEFDEQTGILAAIIYTWAPYRAVDVWVRGALNEATCFVYYPLIVWAGLKFIRTRKFKYAGWMSLLLALLLATHNISFVMFTPFLLVVLAVEFLKHKNIHTLLDFISIGLSVVLMSAFYLFPVLAESNLITINSTTSGYYEYQLHFVTLKQLFISRFWGYGGSVWGDGDGLSLSVGHVVWIPIVGVFLYLIFKKFKPSFSRSFILYSSLMVLAVFLTHGKSEIIWKAIPILPFVQFPWRFLAISTFFGSIAAAFLAKFLPKYLMVLAVMVIVIFGMYQFHPDIWRAVSDNQYFSGSLWDEQRSSALTDFWPKSAKFIPEKFAFEYPQLLYGSAKFSKVFKNGPVASFDADVYSDIAKVNLPIAYFPGWKIDRPANARFEVDEKTGLISVLLTKGSQQKIQLELANTWPRTIGNTVSLLSLAVFVYLMKKYAK